MKTVVKIAIFLSCTFLLTAISTAQEEAGVRSPEQVSPQQTTQQVQVETSVGGEEKVYLNVRDQDIKDIIRQISKATGRNFIIDNKVAGKVTIISERMLTKEEAYQAFLSALDVAGFTTVTGPGGIIKIVPTKQAAQSPIPIHVDTTPYTDSYVTRLIPLQNISANEIQQVIKPLISPSGSAFAYPATNTLIITDSGTNIDRLMKLIKELDQEGPDQSLEIIHIKYANAKDIAQTIIGLFDISGKGGVEAGRAVARRARAAAPELEEMEEVSKIIADERTNSIIVIATKQGIKKIRATIAKLDAPVAGEGTIHVHYLKYASAAEVAQTLSALTTGAKAATKTPGGAPGATAAAAGTVLAALEGGINIVADETTNALIITASAKDYEAIKRDLLDKLDIPRRQVYLESIVMELTLQKTGDYSLKGYGGKYLGAFMPFGQTFGAASNLFDPASSIFGAGGLLGGVLSRDNVSIEVPTAGGGTNTITIPAFSAFLNLVQTYADGNVVSTPNVLTLDNQEAEINIIEKIYAPKTTTTATGIVSVEPVPLEAGLTLKIKPQITEGDAVKLEITHELSNFRGQPTKDIPTPPQTSRKINTTVVAMDGQTVVLGGLMQDFQSSSKAKVPVLGDIPVLGLLFRTSHSDTRKTNLLVFITPHVIKDPTDFSSITKRKIEERNRFIDENYGRRQQRQIRDVIASHRADLLNYVPPSQTGEIGVEQKQPVQQPVAPLPSGTQDIDLGY